jgi:hypothetical protein
VSAAARDWAWAEQRVTDPRDLLVLLELADRHRAEQNPYPGIATIAARTRQCGRSVERSLRRLEQAGVIEGEGHTRRRSYRLDITDTVGGSDGLPITDTVGGSRSTITDSAESITDSAESITDRSEPITDKSGPITDNVVGLTLEPLNPETNPETNPSDSTLDGERGTSGVFASLNDNNGNCDQEHEHGIGDANAAAPDRRSGHDQKNENDEIPPRALDDAYAELKAIANSDPFAELDEVPA